MRKASLIAIASLLFASCGSGGPGSPIPGPAPTPAPTPTPAGGILAPPAQASLSQADIQQIIAQAVAEAQAQTLPVTIAVVDRVGNVLAVFSMNGADLTLRIPPPSGGGPSFDFQGRSFPAPAATVGAIAKAITGAYLSSTQNAFTTRTASQIVQQNFPPSPATVGLESGPLFGVQFSSLPCSDLVTRYNGIASASALTGPKRSPLGLSADPGGFPLYKNGVLVGGVGIMGDGVYGMDPNILDNDHDREETIGVAATQGFAAPESIRAYHITVDGTTLRYSDAEVTDLKSNPATAPGFTAINGTAGHLMSVTAYYDANGGIIPGTVYGSEASGLRLATAAEFSNRDAFVLSDGLGNDRFPIRAGTDGSRVPQPLTRAEVTALLEEAFGVMEAARGQIRQPLDSRAQVSISVVDTNGTVLGLVRGPDAPIFGTDVSLQKARTATFFSSDRAATLLLGNPNADVQHFVAVARTFFGDPNALTGKYAFSDRANGNLSRPYFPDGEVGTSPGPFSRAIESFNPFSTGLQSALIHENVEMHVAAFFGQGADTPPRCTFTPDVAPGQNPLQNGIQIFPGSVPIYRGSTLIGGIGISGDGIDQDDMISFLGLYRAGQRLGTIGEAPMAIRADQIEIPAGDGQIRLRYVNCPFAPFVGSDEQNVCQGK